MCSSGFGFWSHDISGFERTAPPDIYKRWTAFGLLSSHSRLHGNESYRVPWLFDEEAVDVLRFFTKLKCRLMPYIFSAACDAAYKGIPTMRAMFLEFPEDPTCLYLDQQYMLGDSLLVAPIFNDESTAQYYLPAGKWTSLISGEKTEGGGWRNEEHGYMSLPLLARQDSVIPFGKIDDRPDYDYADGVEFHIFELSDGACADSVIYDTSGQKVLEFRASRSGNAISMETAAGGHDRQWSAVLRGLEKVSSVEGGRAEAADMGVRIIPDKGVRTVRVGL